MYLITSAVNFFVPIQCSASQCDAPSEKESIATLTLSYFWSSGQFGLRAIRETVWPIMFGKTVFRTDVRLRPEASQSQLFARLVGSPTRNAAQLWREQDLFLA